MKINEIPTVLKHCKSISQNVILWGPPGIGKTSAVEQYATQSGLRLIHIDAPLVDLLDLKGALTVKEDEVKFTPMSVWPKPDDDPVLVLVDELPQAAPAIQNGFSRLLLRNEIEGVTLPEGSLVVATGNRMEDRSATHRMPAHIVNRLLHIQVAADTDAWYEWAVANGVDERVLAFANFRPGILHDFKPENAHAPYPTYRSWTAVSDWLKTGVTGAAMDDGIAGLIGDGAAMEFRAFMNTKVPDIDRIMAGDFTELHEDLDLSVKYSLSVALAAHVKKGTINTFYKALDILGPVMSVVAVKTLKAQKPELCKGAGFTKWAMEHADLVL